MPAGNGIDAWITELPEGAGDGLHAVTYEGSVPIGEWLGYAYDEDCAPMTGGFALFGETKTIPAGAAYVGFLLLYGGGRRDHQRAALTRSTCSTRTTCTTAAAGLTSPAAAS